MAKNNNNIFKSTITLFLITAIASFSLAFIYAKTKNKIEETEKNKKIKAYSYIFPGCKFSKKKTIEGVKYVIAYKDKKPSGYIVFAEGQGYSSLIKIVFGIDLNKRIKAIKVLYQQETPGLGARCEEIKKTETIFDVIAGKKHKSKEIEKPWFQKQFENLSLKEVKLKKLDPHGKIEAITGATITSNAITKAIHKNMEIFLKHFDEINKNK